MVACPRPSVAEAVVASRGTAGSRGGQGPLCLFSVMLEHRGSWPFAACIMISLVKIIITFTELDYLVGGYYQPVRKFQSIFFGLCITSGLNFFFLSFIFYKKVKKKLFIY